MWDPYDRAVVSEARAEHQLQLWHGEGYHHNMPFEERFQDKATVFTLEPGSRLHFPVGAPHWVKNGPAVSISFSVTFRSYESEKQAIVYFVNSKLRKLGMNPTGPRRSPWKDCLKHAGFQTARVLSRTIARSCLQRNQNKWA
jgi:hypothetical protein